MKIRQSLLSAGAFQVAEGLDLVLASAALGASALWWALGRTAARRHWAGVFTWVYMPLSLVLPVYGGFSAWKFWGKGWGGEGREAGGPINPVKFAVLVGLALACRMVLMWAAWKMRASPDFTRTPGVLRQIVEARRQARPSVAFADMIVDERGDNGR